MPVWSPKVRNCLRLSRLIRCWFIKHKVGVLATVFLNWIMSCLGAGQGAVKSFQLSFEMKSERKVSDDWCCFDLCEFYFVALWSGFMKSAPSIKIIIIIRAAGQKIGQETQCPTWLARQTSEISTAETALHFTVLVCAALCRIEIPKNVPALSCWFFH